MISFLKKHFIPGPHNDHQPHILRKKAVFFILGLVLIVECIFLIQMLYVVPHVSWFSSVLSNVLVDLTNADRLSNNVFPLKGSSLLQEAAQLKAKDMASNSYFSHTSPDGKTPWEWLYEVGYSFTHAGENLAVNFIDSKDIERAWMNSESHKKNILNNNFTEIGIGTATGVYKNREAIFVVQFFGRPAKENSIVKADIIPSKITEESSIKTEGAVKGEEAFIAVQNNDIQPAELEIATKGVSRPSIWQRIFVMPKTVINYIYLFIAGFVLIALILKIFVKIKIQYPRLIFNGIVILFVIISILYFNSWIFSQGYTL